MGGPAFLSFPFRRQFVFKLVKSSLATSYNDCLFWPYLRLASILVR